jgi:hypothetical protein
MEFLTQQYSYVMNQTLSACVDFNLIGGGACVTNDFGCSGNGQCVVGRNATRFCECFDGWMCPNCQTKIADFLSQSGQGTTFFCFSQFAECPEPQTFPPSGAGPCESAADCGNYEGQCISGSCLCHQDRFCSNCQVDVWSVQKGT